MKLGKVGIVHGCACACMHASVCVMAGVCVCVCVNMGVCACVCDYREVDKRTLGLFFWRAEQLGIGLMG